MDNNSLVTFIGGIIVVVIFGVWNGLKRGNNKTAQKITDTETNLNARISDLTKDMEAIEQRLDEKNQEVGRLQVRITELQTEIDNLKKSNQDANQKADAIAKERDEEVRKRAALAEELAGERSTTAALERRIHELEITVTDLKNQLAVNKTVDQIVESLKVAFQQAARPIATEVNPT